MTDESSKDGVRKDFEEMKEHAKASIAYEATLQEMEAIVAERKVAYPALSASTKELRAAVANVKQICN